MDEQYAFVEYYDIVKEEAVLADGVGVHFIRLKRDGHGDDNEGRERGKVFRLFPVDSARGGVLVVRFNALLQLLHDIVSYKNAIHIHLITTSKRQIDIFYVNRLYSNEDYRFKVTQ